MVSFENSAVSKEIAVSLTQLAGLNVSIQGHSRILPCLDRGGNA